MSHPTIAYATRDGVPVFATIAPTRELASAEAARAAEHRGAVAHVLPIEGPRPYGDDWASQRHLEHVEKYSRLAQRIGPAALASIVPFTRDQIRAALVSGDAHLNTLPLRHWDSCHALVRQWARRDGIKGWSMADTVCVLKHVAVFHMSAGLR